MHRRHGKSAPPCCHTQNAAHLCGHDVTQLSRNVPAAKHFCQEAAAFFCGWSPGRVSCVGIRSLQPTTDARMYAL